VSRIRLFIAAFAATAAILLLAAQTQAQTVGPGLLFAAGSGSVQTETFTSTSSKVNVCWTVSGQSPSGAFGPSAAFFLKSANGNIWGPEFDVEQPSQTCSAAALAPGTYFVNVIATPWTQWTLTITPA
jgi:hypothetical protein